MRCTECSRADYSGHRTQNGQLRLAAFGLGLQGLNGWFGEDRGESADHGFWPNGVAPRTGVADVKVKVELPERSSLAMSDDSCLEFKTSSPIEARIGIPPCIFKPQNLTARIEPRSRFSRGPPYKITAGNAAKQLYELCGAGETVTIVHRMARKPLAHFCQGRPPLEQMSLHKVYPSRRRNPQQRAGIDPKRPVPSGPFRGT